MTGIIDHGGKRATNVGTPTAATDAATKQYVDTATGLLLPKAGGTMTGAINMGSKKITNLATPTAATDASTKGYVDDVVSPLAALPGLLTGGSIRKIYAGATYSNTSYYESVVTDALILGGVMAITIAPPNSKARHPSVLTPIGGSASGNFEVFFYGDQSSTSGQFTVINLHGWESNGNQTVDGASYPRKYLRNGIPANKMALVLIYSADGFVYAD